MSNMSSRSGHAIEPTRRHWRGAVRMAAERVIAAVQNRVPVVGVGHPGLEVVGDHLLRAADDIGEGADMGTEPVLVTLGPARFGVEPAPAKAGVRSEHGKQATKTCAWRTTPLSMTLSV